MLLTHIVMNHSIAQAHKSIAFPPEIPNYLIRLCNEDLSPKLEVFTKMEVGVKPYAKRLQTFGQPCKKALTP